MISKVREVLNDFLPDVWIYSDLCKGSRGGVSQGIGINLVAETNENCFISIDETYDPYQD